MTGGPIEENSVHAEIRVVLGLPNDQLYYYSDINSEDSKEEILEWDIESECKAGHIIVLTTSKRTARIHSKFLSSMQSPSFSEIVV